MQIFRAIKQFFFPYTSENTPKLAPPPSGTVTHVSQKKTTPPLHKRRVEPGCEFYLKDGKEAATIQELYELLQTVPPEIILDHMTGDQNDFAVWIHDCLHASGIASIIESTRTKDELMYILRETCK